MKIRSFLCYGFLFSGLDVLLSPLLIDYAWVWSLVCYKESDFHLLLTLDFCADS